MSRFAAILAAVVVATAIGPSRAAPPDEGDARGELGFGKTLSGLELAIRLTDDEPTEGVQQLARALRRLEGHAPQVATDPRAKELHLRGWLTLARGYLAVDRDADANAAMDEAIRILRGGTPPAEDYGPSTSALMQARMDAVRSRGTAAISVECGVPCRILIDERPAAAQESGLPLGAYRLRVDARDGSTAPMVLEVELVEAGTTIEIGYQTAATPGPTSAGPAPEDPAPEDPVPEDPAPEALAPAGPEPEPSPMPGPPPAPDRTKRLAPLWLEIVGITAGAGLTITGATLLAQDGTCYGGGSPTGADACDRVFETRRAGLATLVPGVIVFTPSVVATVIDGVRARNARRSGVSMHRTRFLAER